MGTTLNSGIMILIPRLFVVVLILVLCLLGLIYVVRRQDEIEESLNQHQQQIIETRQKRYQLLRQIRILFGENNPDTKNIDLLIQAYELVSNEDEEIAWENKYIVIIHRFMEYTKQHLRAETEQSYEMATEALSDNEQQLFTLRSEYETAKESARAFMSPPLSYVGSVGDKLTELIKKHHTSKHEIIDEENQ